MGVIYCITPFCIYLCLSLFIVLNLIPNLPFHSIVNPCPRKKLLTPRIMNLLLKMMIALMMKSYVDNTSEYDTPDEEYLSDDDQNNYTVLVTAFTDELFDILWKKNESYQLTIKINEIVDAVLEAVENTIKNNNIRINREY